MGRQIGAVLGSAVLGSAVLGLASLRSAALGALALAFIASSPLAIAQQSREPGASAKPAGAPAAPATLAPGSGNAAKDRQVYLSIKDLMESIIDPSADTLWGAVGTVVDTDGAHEAFPKTQEEWLETRRAAIRMIEGGNLLMMPGREAAPVGTKSEAPGAELEPPQITALIKQKRKSFDAFARSLQGAGTEALRAIDAKNPALLLDVGAQIESVCEGCHQTFWYPPEKDASTGAGTIDVSRPGKRRR
jgi:hypothetical protein